MNSFVWNMRYQMQLQLTELMCGQGSGVGAKVVPGSYIVRLIEDKTIIAEAAVEIKLDPRVTTTMLI
jgi:hypothetical protein